MVVTLSLRKTHRYVGEYQHEDKWEDLGDIDELVRRIVPPTTEEEKAAEEDICEPRTEEVFCRVKLYEATTTPEQIKQALHDSYTKSGCAHDWDCCGCRSYHAGTVEHLGGDVWRVQIDSSRNY